MSFNLLYSKKNTRIKYVQNPEYRYLIWRPGFRSLLPPNKGKKYLIYTFFYFTSIFKNKNYFGVNLFFNEEVAASLLVVPAYFKWSFMKKKDVQIIYVMTKPEFRGNGLAIEMIKFTLSNLPKDVNSIWYVTDKDNSSSRRVAEKLNFKLNNNLS